MIPEGLERGDLVEVHWVDIVESVDSDPAEAQLALRISIGYFHGEKESKGFPCIVTSTTKDEEVTQSGWCIYPKCVIASVKVIKRKRRRRKAIDASNS